MTHALQITLIGMAGIGKSTWAARLERRGFLRIDCDRMIAERLSTELAGAGDLIAALGSWMGLPWEPGYEERAMRYQHLEKAVMEEVLENLGRAQGKNDIVVDTAGSVIYTGDDVLDELAGQSVVVHLASPHEDRERLLEDYLKRPGPVLWHGMFRPAPGEPHQQAVARCYAELLEDRERRYTRLAHITLDYRAHREGDLSLESFLGRARSFSRGQG
ncbi:MAG: shikimate kinase [Thermodesulfobacteriota bacterium]